MIFLLKVIGSLLVYSPEFIPRAISNSLGYFIYYALPSRRRIVLSNLFHCFPESKHNWRRRIALQSCCQTVETGMLGLIIPFLSKDRISSMLHIPPKTRETLKKIADGNRPFLLCSPHLGAWELMTTFPGQLDHAFPKVGVVYRPLKNKKLNQWVVNSREKFGMSLLSRRQGFSEGMKILRAGGGYGVLFDQNAGDLGTLSLFFDRLTSTTELPGLLGEKFNTIVTTIHTERIAFWHYSLRVKIHEIPSKSENITNHLNSWLENLLRSNDSTCSSWLWLHDRWRTQYVPEKRFRIQSKRTLISKTQEPAKTTKFWIRLPAQLDEILRIIPSIRALRKARTDGELTLISRSRYIPLLKCLKIGDEFLSLPDRNIKSFLKIFKWRIQYPDTLIIFPSSIRHDIEAWLIGARQRFGIEINGRQRPLLTHTWKVPQELDQRTLHQSRIWEMFLTHFGLLEKPNFSPLEIPEGDLPSHLDLPKTTLIGIISGAEYNQTKCWPIGHWKQLLHDLSRELPFLHFVFFGNSFDRLNVHQMTQGVPKESVHNLAGQISLIETAHLLKKCSIVIGNDDGNLHLANALGVPVIGLYGPSNPIRTGPVYAGSTQVIQPPHSQPTGATHLSDLQPRQVKQAIQASMSRIQNSILGDPL